MPTKKTPKKTVNKPMKFSKRDNSYNLQMNTLKDYMLNECREELAIVECKMMKIFSDVAIHAFKEHKDDERIGAVRIEFDRDGIKISAFDNKILKKMDELPDGFKKITYKDA